MNFPELLNNDKYSRIIIPRLQRDYAQGREDTKATEIRETLLEDIFTNDSTSLNIIFGECDGNDYIIVDGQQRLTTLFLLYLYRSKMHGINLYGLNKFSYETRHSTIDFLKVLIENEWDPEIKQRGVKIAKWIKQQGWYVWPWQHDPTVCGMLTMLDAIQEKEKHYRKFPNLDKIDFDFLDMGELGLNETLYLKMNSRGKYLNAFEKIKSGLDAALSKATIGLDKALIDNDMLTTFEDWWRWRMDRDWNNWFWDKANPYSQDNYFLCFIQYFTIAFYISNTKIETNSRSEYIRDDILNNLNVNAVDISWKKIKEAIEKVHDQDSDIIEPAFFNGLANLLKRATRRSGEYIAPWGEKFCINRLDANKIPDIKLTAFLWALSSFGGDSFNTEEFKQWVRFTFNMICNTVDSFDSLVRFIKRCTNHYALHSMNLLEWLCGSPLEVNDNSEQWAEECEKAHYFINSSDKEIEIKEAILDAEKHNLLRGRIRPVILASENNNIDASVILKRWANYNLIFDSNHAIGTAAEIFRKIFSYCDFWNDLYWNHYVFNNSETIWRERLLSQNYYTTGIYHLLNGNSKNKSISSLELATLCAPGVMEEILEKANDDWYIREPNRSLRPYGSFYDGIRLEQNDVKNCVNTLLTIPEVKFADEASKNFYDKTGLVWGVRIKFNYKSFPFILWNDFRINVDGEWLEDKSGKQINVKDIDNVSLENALSNFLSNKKQTSDY